MMFQSFLQGGFECSTHRRADGKRLDVIAATRHDMHAAEDYALLRTLGIRTVRDGMRWHRIDQGAGRYDWSSLMPMLYAAEDTKTQVIWDLMHYGWPDDLDIWSPAFVDRFAAFATAAAKVVQDTSDAVPWYCPVNEISFMAWAGGQHAVFAPMGRWRGHELKMQLVRAAIAAIEAVRAVDPRARFMHADPVINVVPAPGKPASKARARDLTHAQFQAWDMLSGRTYPELGGRADYLDVIGINYYVHNQWVVGSEPLDWQTDDRYLPFHRLLDRVHRRYRRPMLIAETGIEDDLRAPWLAVMCDEVDKARELGMPVHGLCLYPVMNHPGWADDRHCPNGLIDYCRKHFERSLHQPLADEVLKQGVRFGSMVEPLELQQPDQTTRRRIA